MGIDISQINTDTTIGQVAFLFSVIVAGVVALRPVLKDLKSGRSGKKYLVIANELELVKRELSFALQIQRHNSEWQMTARELIRLTRLELADAGVPVDKRLKRLATRLEEIEDEDIYSKHIIPKEVEEP